MRKRPHLDTQTATGLGCLRRVPVVGLDGKLSLAPCNLGRQPAQKNAETAYDNWKSFLPDNISPYFSDLIRAVDNWHTEIFNYFDCRITNAFAECVNNHIKAIIARQGRGYVLRARTLFTHVKHKLKPKSFRSGYRQQMDRMQAGVAEKVIDYSGVSRDENLDYGAIFPHGFAKSPY